ncbi:MAG TPA: hypothetical protein VK912_02315 [Longimicrobiales bacterium]|nr:hypothetical protein [Longimicrobiales bacterium]
MMIMNNTAFRSAMILATAGLLGACGGSGEVDDNVAADSGMSGMEGHDMSAMGGTDMSMDSATMQRHAAEMDSMATELRAHVAELRQLPQAQWHARMDQHAPLVARMLGMMERQMREMDMGMGMDADHMGEMMGMTGDEHEAMLQEMTTLRAEVGQLQTATPEEVRAQMPAHLARLQRMVEIMEASADHMGGM